MCLKNTRPTIEFVTNEMVTKRFGLTEPHPIWDTERLTQLTRVLYNNVYLEKRVHSLENFTSTVRGVIHYVLKELIHDETILKIYWEEFKLFRTKYKTAYDNAIERGCLNNTKLAEFIVLLFGRHNITIDPLKHSVYTFLENYMASTSINECKICYNKGVDGVFVHDTHACTVCTTCALKCMADQSTCPFCKLHIQRFVKLLVP